MKSNRTEIVHASSRLFATEGRGYKKGKVVSRQPIFIVNLKSNTMKNTMQI